MALVFSDGFDSYAATADLTKKWGLVASSWTWSTGADQNGATNGIISAATTTGPILVPRSNVFGGASRVGIGFWLKVSAAPANADFLFICNSVGTPLGYFRLAITTGFIVFLNASSGLVTTGITNVCDNAWHWIEISFQIGTLVNQRCMVDATSQWNGNFTSSATGAIDRFYMMSLASRTTSLSDILAYDSAGTLTPAVDFPLGARKITTLRPNGDDAVQFTRSTGSTSYTLLDEVNADASDYVESNTVNNQDTYDYGALGFTPTTVNAVMVNSYMQASSAGSIYCKQVAKSGGVVASGPTILLPSAPIIKQQPFHVDPNTAAAWTESGINAAKFGINMPGIVGTPTLVGYEYEEGIGSAYTSWYVYGVGGTLPYTFSLLSGTLPSGITLNTSTGLVSGTPAFESAGVYANIVIRMTDGAAVVSDLDAFTITIAYKDPYFSSTKLLLDADAADASTVFTDLSAATRGTGTTQGNAQHDTGVAPPYGTSWFLFDGTGDAIQFADSNDWIHGSGPFTWDFIIRPATIAAGTRMIVSQWASNGNLNFVIFQDAAIVYFQGTTGGSTATLFADLTTTIAANTTYHFRVSFDGTKYRMFVNGTMVSSSTTLRAMTFNSSATLNIGSNAGGGSFFFNGHMKGIRFTLGAARTPSDAGYTLTARSLPTS